MANCSLWRKVGFAAIALVLGAGGYLGYRDTIPLSTSATEGKASASAFVVTPHYRSVQISAADAPSSDAVLFFWYGCPHCRRVEQIFRRESAEQKINALLGKGQHFIKVPAPINEMWEMHARLYYALEHLGVSSDTHWYVMNSIQDNGLYAFSQLSERLTEIAQYVTEHNPGVVTDAAQISADMQSSETDKDIAKAKALLNAAGLQGVPAMLVNKSKLIELGNRTGYDQMLPGTLTLLSEHK